jgi:hypothetical protein
MTKSELTAVLEKASGIFKELMSYYPGLKGYLVFSSPYGQCVLTSDLKEILKDFPEMIHDSIDKKRGIELIGKIQDFETDKKDSYSLKMRDEITKKIVKAQHDLELVLDKLDVQEDIFIEIRFSNPLPDLIFKMQKDPLVSQEHTPQTNASIQIVLGTLGEIKLRAGL